MFLSMVRVVNQFDGLVVLRLDGGVLLVIAQALELLRGFSADKQKACLRRLFAG